HRWEVLVGEPRSAPAPRPAARSHGGDDSLLRRSAARRLQARDRAVARELLRGRRRRWLHLRVSAPGERAVQRGDGIVFLVPGLVVLGPWPRAPARLPPP